MSDTAKRFGIDCSDILEEAEGNEMSVGKFVRITLEEIAALPTWAPKPGEIAPAVHPGVMEVLGRR